MNSTAVYPTRYLFLILCMSPEMESDLSQFTQLGMAVGSWNVHVQIPISGLFLLCHTTAPISARVSWDGGAESPGAWQCQWSMQPHCGAAPLPPSWLEGNTGFFSVLTFPPVLGPRFFLFSHSGSCRHLTEALCLDSAGAQPWAGIHGFMQAHWKVPFPPKALFIKG